MNSTTTSALDEASATATTLVAKQLNLLLAGLLQAARTTTDVTKLIQLNNEMLAVQSLIDKASQAQAAANDAVFSQATASLRAQAAMLTDMEAHITGIVGDVATAGKIVGYITKALSLIARI